MATEKVKQLGKYGSRYGVGIRKRLLKIEPRQRAEQYCPLCGFPKAKRDSPGIYCCGKCGKTFSGGAYLPETDTGKIIRKMVAQKNYLSQAVELLSTKDSFVSGEGSDTSGESENKGKRRGREERENRKPRQKTESRKRAKSDIEESEE